MRKVKKLRITIYSNGYIQTETQGIKGKTCEQYFPFFKKILQNRIVDQMYTEEYYEEAVEETDVLERECVKI